MSRVFAHAGELRETLSAFLDRFFQSGDGIEMAAEAAGLELPAMLELRVHDPDLVLLVDFARRRVADPAEGPPAATASIDADALHHLLMDNLGPIEISRLAEEGRVRLDGPPLVLGSLLVAAGRVQPHYRASLEERGSRRLLDAPPPETAVIWGNDDAPPSLIGVRRPWQRP